MLREFACTQLLHWAACCCAVDGTLWWGRYARESLVTDTEDVSYVSSPYLPMCLRHGGREITSNASKAHLSSGGETNIRDELDEVGATAGHSVD